MSIYDNVGSDFDSMRNHVGVKDILEQVNVLGNEIRVLDLGCGTGHPIAKAISPVVNQYRGIDNSQPMLDAYMKNVQDADCVLMEMSELELISGQWDFIFSWGAICHLPIEQQKKTMSVVSSLLKPGGRFLFTSGKDADECTGKVGQYTVYHYSMGRRAYVEFLNENEMALIDARFSEGDFYVYTFRKGME
ncbi:MAG: class I SAM-dependent methyltransferase [Desulfobacteraceae bacterium]|nr:MAG: class I SAM-dependent methyltransferase [Desulfobacteraceae bacterium]